MRRSIELLIGEMESKLGGYAGLLNYRFMNLCVKAEPAALLTVVVMSSDGERLNLEKVARARLANKFQYEIVPMSSDLLAPICKGFMDAHPEFKQEVVTPDDDHRIYPNQEDEKQFYQKAAKALRQLLLKDGFGSSMGIIMPYSFVLETETGEHVDELFIADTDDTIIIGGAFMENLEKDLDDFMKHLMED